MFADDIALIAQSRSKLEKLFSHVVEFCTEERLTISEAKTKLMVCGVDAKDYSDIRSVKLLDYTFDVV